MLEVLLCGLVANKPGFGAVGEGSIPAQRPSFLALI